MHLRHTGILCTGLSPWSQLDHAHWDAAAAAQAVGEADDGGEGDALRRGAARHLRRFCTAEAFALETRGERQVDMVVDRVRVRWSQAMQLRVLKVR